MSPSEIAIKLAPRYPKGTITYCEISEDMTGMWAVRIEVKPNDKRKRTQKIAGYGVSRQAAIQEFLEEYRVVDYLFYCGHPKTYGCDGGSETWVVIIRQKFWEDQGHLDDRHITGDLINNNMMPKFLCEIMDSTFESSLSVEKTVANLEKLGFKRNLSFSKFSETHNPFI